MESLSIEGRGYKKIEKETREFYASIDRIWCSRLSAFIIFNRAGFQHLVRRGRVQRPKSEQKRRFVLLLYVGEIISDSEANISYKRKTLECSGAEFWIFKKNINEILITVVLRRIGDGNIHFFSIYQNKNPS